MTALPDQFSELAPFVDDWALTNEEDRFRKLMATRIEVLREFYDAMAPRAEEVANYLNGLDLKTMPDDARNLFHLLITFVETAHPIKLQWKTTDIDDAFPPERFGFGDASRTSLI